MFNFNINIVYWSVYQILSITKNDCSPSKNEVTSFNSILHQNLHMNEVLIWKYNISDSCIIVFNCAVINILIYSYVLQMLTLQNVPQNCVSLMATAMKNKWLLLSKYFLINMILYWYTILKICHSFQIELVFLICR